MYPTERTELLKHISVQWYNKKGESPKKNVILPPNMSIEEASGFWDEHSLLEFEGTEEVQVDFHLRKKQYVGIDWEVFKRLEARARQMKISPEALLESWIAEKIES